MYEDDSPKHLDKEKKRDLRGEDSELDSTTKSELITAQILVVFFAATTVALMVALFIPVLKIQPFKNPTLAMHLIKFQLSRAADEDGIFLQKALIAAIRDQNVDMVQALVQKQDVSTSQFEADDLMTPLHWAVNAQNVDIMKAVLRETRHSVLDSRDGRGYSALHYALAKNWKAGYDMLLTAGSAVDTTSPCSNDITPFHMAAHTSSQATKDLLDFAPTNRQKIENSGDNEEDRKRSLVNLPQKDGLTPLHISLAMDSLMLPVFW